MLTAIVLVCAITDTITLAECDRISARDVMTVPGSFVSNAACFFGGQAYLATNALGAFDRSRYAAKVVCSRRHLASSKNPD